MLLAINDAPVPKAAHVARRLYRAGQWTLLRYKLERNGEEFETRLITTPPHKPISVENYLRVVGLLYLFIGLFHFCTPLECAACRALLRFLPGVVCPVLVSVQRKTGRIRSGSLLGKRSGPFAGTGSVAAFCPGFPRTPGNFTQILAEIRGGLCAAAGAAADSHSRGIQCHGFCAHHQVARGTGPVGTWIPRLLFSCCRADLQSELPADAVRRFAPATQMADGRNACRQPAVHRAVYPAVHLSTQPPGRGCSSPRSAWC